MKNIKSFFNMIPHKEFIKNVSILMGGTALANLIAIFSSPILSRLFTPENFGALALFTSLSVILANISSLSYEQAIVINHETEGTIHIKRLCLAILFGFVALVTIIILFFGEAIISFFKNPELKHWIYAIPVMILMTGYFQINKNVFMRHKAFKIISISNVIMNTTAAAAKIFLGLTIGAMTGNLIIGALIGTLAALLFMLLNTKAATNTNTRYSFAQLIFYFKKYKDFPLFNNWTQLLNICSENMTVIFLSIFFSPAIVGLYSLCKRIVRIPVQYVSSAFADVFFQKASEQSSDIIRLKKNFIKSTLFLSALGIIPFAVLAIFGRPIFEFVFGDKWGLSGKYAMILAPGFFFVFINKPATTVYLVMELLRIRLIYTLVFSISRALSLVLGYYLYHDPEICLLYYSATLVCFNLFFIIFAYYLLSKSSRNTKDTSHKKPMVVFNLSNSG